MGMVNHKAIRRRSWSFSVVILILLMSAMAELNPVQAQGRTGNFCVEDLTAPQNPNCTANDTSVARFNWLVVTDPCVNFTGDTTTFTYEAEWVAGNPDRYDLGIVVDRSGAANGARDGDDCYHDFLPPPVSAAATPPGPPFLDDEGGGDVCGDGGPVGANWIRQFPSITVVCADNYDSSGALNPDGVADVEVCSTWKNNRSGTCTDVTGAIPGTSSKCGCRGWNLFSTTSVQMQSFGADSDETPVWAVGLTALGALLALAVIRQRRGGLHTTRPY